jgi:phosphoglycerate dehydrogenase-like enzyme
MAMNDNGTLRVMIADDEYAATAATLGDRFEQLELLCPAEGQELPVVADGKADVLITQFVPVDGALLDDLSGLRAVIKMGSNYKNIDANAVRERNLIFASVPRKGPNCVAELAMTLILALSKDLLISHAAVADGAYRLRGLRPIKTEQWKMAFHWMRHTMVHEVRGKTLGIVGMGEIGAELALRARVMGMKNLYFTRTQLYPELEQRFGAEYRSLEDLLKESDYLTLAVPHTSDTEKMIGAEQLAMMKSDAFLVNICRGGVVDEEALIDALMHDRLAGAGLDVFEYEPLPADSLLCDLDNVILTPHIGGGSGTNREIELTAVLEETQAILSGKQPTVDLGQFGRKQHALVT